MNQRRCFALMEAILFFFCFLVPHAVLAVGAYAYVFPASIIGILLWRAVGIPAVRIGTVWLDFILFVNAVVSCLIAFVLFLVGIWG